MNSHAIMLIMQQAIKHKSEKPKPAPATCMGSSIGPEAIRTLIKVLKAVKGFIVVDPAPSPPIYILIMSNCLNHLILPPLLHYSAR